MKISNIQKYFLLAALVLPAMSFAADMKIKNNTQSYATAQTTTSPCSSVVGDKGVLKPGGSIDVPPVVFDMYCPRTCNVQVYMNKSCSGRRVATVQVHHDKGVTGVTNHGVGNYTVSGSGHTVQING